MIEYKTVSGDTFDSIAYKQYGNERQALDIIKANIDYANIIIFSEGIKLDIPDISGISSTNIKLPPWKRGD
ncbi:tail protein X [Sedimentibacter acidaminivorans]|uniref:tail protein X n=1 Tax=Sedimentibacter acidaminivorans TaxID=913099 RepID=UPI001AE6501C